MKRCLFLLLLSVLFSCGDRDHSGESYRILSDWQQLEFTFSSKDAKQPNKAKKVKIRWDSRDAVKLPMNTTVSINVQIEAKASLDFGYGMATIDWQHGKPATLQVQAVSDSETSTLFRETIEPSPREFEPLWSDERIDLGAYVGQQIKLVFRIEGPEDSPAQMALGNPRIVYPRPEQARNLIVISLDTLRADQMNLYGYKEARTSPYLDLFAEDGVHFEQAFSNAPWTMPAHMSLFTSLYPSAHGLMRPVREMEKVMYRVAPHIPTLAEILRNQGFTTAAFTGSGSITGTMGFWNGFDIWNETTMNHGSDIDLVYTKMADWLDKNSNQHFFLFFHTYEVHLPNTHTALLDNLQKSNSNINSLRHRLGYNSDLRFTDRILGLFFHTLKDKGLYENSIIVLVSDHGENLYDRMVDSFPTGHGYHLYNEMLHIPFIFVAPGLLPKDVSLKGPVQLVDVMPTVLSLLGVQNGQHLMQGRDLTAAMMGKEQLSEVPIFAESTAYGPERKAVRRGKYKFIRIQDRAFVKVRKPPGKIPWDWNQLPTEELFDLESDPGETNNLAEDLPAVTAQMARLLDEIEEINEQINAGAPAEPTGVDEALQEKLRALGYIQ